MNRFCRHLCEGMIAVSIALPVPTLAQQARSVPVAVEARNDLPEVEVNATLTVLSNDGRGNRALTVTSRQSFGSGVNDALAVGDGERMDICVTATRSGYFTVWSKDVNEATPYRIYPNDFSSESVSQRAGIIDVGEEKCIGQMPEFKLKATGPAGKVAISVVWTDSPDKQLTQDDYPTIGRSAGLSARSLPTDSYASTTLYFDVTE